MNIFFFIKFYKIVLYMLDYNYKRNNYKEDTNE